MRKQLERIYREHRQGLFTLALSITRSPDLAEDAVQEAFARLWRSTARPEGDVVSYVFASVRNAAVDQARLRSAPGGPAVSIFDCDQTVDRTSPLSAAIGAERREGVRRAVDALPPKQQETVVLRLYAGLTFQQIADTLGEPLQTVASRYRRALEQIRESLENLT